jgi:hypothetical protein
MLKIIFWTWSKRRCLILLALTFVVFTSGRPVDLHHCKPSCVYSPKLKLLPSVQGEADIVLDNGLLKLIFNGPKGNFALKGLYALFNDKTIVYPYLNSSEPYPFWQVEYRDRQGLGVFADNGVVASKTFSLRENNSLWLNWTNAIVFPTQLRVNVSVYVQLKERFSYWRIFISTPPTSEYTLWRVSFISLNNIGPQNSTLHTVIYSSNALGQSVPPSFITEHYPSSSQSMQFTAFASPLPEKLPLVSPSLQPQIMLYYGHHDPRGVQKENSIYPQQKGVGTTWTLFPETMGIVGGGTFATNYDIVIGGLVGDYWDAAQVYRTWVTRNAVWTSRGDMKGRVDIPQWFKELSFWINTSWNEGVLNSTCGNPDIVKRNVDEFLTLFPKIKKAALHWYTWHQIPFDTNYPQYLPAKAGFQQTVQYLQSKGIHVVPYINGRLFDINTQSWKTDNAGLYATTMSSPRAQPQEFPYYLEEYGSLQLFAVMCPFTSYWQRKISTIVQTLASAYAVSGVYIDQIAAAPARLCFSQNHGHSSGGGAYWNIGYGALIDGARKKIPSSSFLITESNAETYMQSIHGHLVIAGYTCNMVPLFQSVYSDYAITIGQYFTPLDLLEDPNVFSVKFAQMFVYGTQLGWFALDGFIGMLPTLKLPQYKIYRTFVETLDAFRSLPQAIDLFVYGHMMRPLVVNGTIPSIYVSYVDCQHPAVVSSAFYSKYTNNLGIFIVNGLATKTVTVGFAFDVTLQYPLPPQANYTLSQVFVDGSTKILRQQTNSYFSFLTSLSPLEVRFYLLQAKEFKN